MLVVGKYLNVIRHSFQTMIFQIYRTVTTDFFQYIHIFLIFGSMNDNFFLKQMSGLTYAKQLTEESSIYIYVKDYRIFIRFIRKESSQRCQHNSTHPCSQDNIHFTTLGNTRGSRVYNIVNYKNQYGNYDRHTQSTLPDNSSQRRTDKEKYNTRQ